MSARPQVDKRLIVRPRPQLALLFMALAVGCGSISLNESHDGAAPGGDGGKPTTMTDGGLAGTGGSGSHADAAGAAGGSAGTSSTTGIAGQGAAGAAAGASGFPGVGGTVGKAGTTGTSGTTGAAGIAGTAGMTGAAGCQGLEPRPVTEHVTIAGCGLSPGTTAAAYSGLVTLRISGLVVTTPGESAQDAFYQVNPKDTSMAANACAECVRYGRVGDRDCLYGNPTGSVCLVECGADATFRFPDLIVGSYPSFRPSHDYTVTLDLGKKSPARLRIGIADCGCSDNAGSYALTLTPVGDSSTCNP